MLHRTAILYLTLPLAMPCTTMAQPSATPPSQHASASAGYGSYIIAVDAVIVASAMTLDSEYVLIGGYLLSGPVFHIGHGRPGAAFASLALRATLPALGMLAGAAVTGGGESLGSDGEYQVLGVGIGGALGIIIASTIDGLLLARSAVEPREEQRLDPLEVGATSVRPMVARTSFGAWSFGLIGTF